MPGTVTPSRRRRVTKSEDEDDESEVASSRSSKRARTETPVGDSAANHLPEDSWLLSPPAASRQDDPEDGPLLPDSFIVSPPRIPRTIQNGGNNASSAQAPSEHKPGSIVRIRLENFVTYTAVEIHPGPALNMVIGPNGTGKSTLVCAICLGLGWGTKNLARQKEVGEFVKLGSDEAIIEIELKGNEGDRNPIFKRQIKRQGNVTHWFLNGQPTNLKSVRAVAEGFSIQIDNLCQFLPQDRVIEFAALSPVDLLSSTQRAAAPAYMIEWQEELKTLRMQQKKEQADESSKRETLKNLENRQNLQRADVERLRERSEVVHELKMLETIRPVAEYNLAKQEWKTIKEKRERLKRELKELTQEVKPTLTAMNSKGEYKEAVDKVLSQDKRNMERMELEIEKSVRKMGAVEEEYKTCDVQRKSEKASSLEKKQIRVRLERDITRLKNQMAQEPIEFDAAEMNARAREKTRKIRDLDEEDADRMQAGRDKKSEQAIRRGRIAEAERQLKDLHSQSGQQESKLRQASRDTADAWKWIKENKDQFEDEVFGPPLTECSVTDKRYVNLIEAVLQRNDFLALSVKNRSDLRKLQEQLYNVMKLKDISIRSVNNDRYEAPVSDEVRQNLGLDGWAIDFLTGPEPVLSMLCADARLNQTGVASRDISNQQFEALEQSQVSSWVTPKSSYQITRRREYGPGATSTRVRPVAEAQFWTTQSVDVRLENDLKDNINGWTHEIEELQKAAEHIGARLREIRKLKEELEAEKKAIDQEKYEKQKALAEYNAIPTKLATLEAKLADILEDESKLRERLDALTDQENALALQKAQLAVKHASLVDSLRAFHLTLLKVSITSIEAHSDHETLQELNSTINERVATMEREFRAADQDFQRARSHAQGLSKTSQDVMADEQVMAYYLALSEEQRNRLPDELEVEIGSFKARLDLLHEGNPRAIQEYEERQRRIDALQRDLAGMTTSLATLAEQIAAVRAKWEPQLDALIAQISAAFGASFAQINCAGEVGVLKPDDFDQWAVQVFVKFREHEPLSLLTAYRQSGGERAVSTIFYLMALQSLSRAPFRVVDEINQGMDPRNERVVHGRIVDVACGGADGSGATSQYFLITPKLLPGLRYAPGMVVHCIASGEMMPADCRKLDFKALVRRARTAKEREAEAGARAVAVA